MQQRSELRECLETRSGNFNEKQRDFAVSPSLVPNAFFQPFNRSPDDG